MPIGVVLRRNVLERDRYRCVYCRTTQDNSGQQLQIDHILPVADGGATSFENLCACCISCNSHKWARRRGVDLLSGELVPLYHPLQQIWAEHFAWNESGTVILGLSSTGRATINALQMNNDTVVRARRRWVEAGWHPPT